MKLIEARLEYVLVFNHKLSFVRVRKVVILTLVLFRKREKVGWGLIFRRGV